MDSGEVSLNSVLLCFGCVTEIQHSPISTAVFMLVLAVHFHSNTNAATAPGLASAWLLHPLVVTAGK